MKKSLLAIAVVAMCGFAMVSCESKEEKAAKAAEEVLDKTTEKAKELQDNAAENAQKMMDAAKGE